MNKQELIDTLAKTMGLSKSAATQTFTTIVSAITKSLASGSKVSISGFGTWNVSQRPARKGVNPRNLSEVIQIAPTKVVRFRAGKALKDAIKK